MTPSRSSEIEADLAGDHRPPPSATAADPADHEADRSRLAEEIAWLVHRWLRLGRPPQDPNEFPVQIDGPSQP